MQLSTNVTDYESGPLGLVETAASMLNDREHRFWSKSELITYINFAQDQLANIINTMYREYYLNKYTTTTVAGQSVYSVPDEMINLLDISIADDAADNEEQGLREIMVQDRQFYQMLDAANRKVDYGWFFVYDRKFQINPEPRGGGEEVRMFIVERLAHMSDDQAVSRIPLQHHELLALKGAKRGQLKSREINANLEVLDRELTQILKDEVGYQSRLKPETTQPYWGSQYPYLEYGHRRWTK